MKTWNWRGFPMGLYPFLLIAGLAAFLVQAGCAESGDDDLSAVPGDDDQSTSPNPGDDDQTSGDDDQTSGPADADGDGVLTPLDCDDQDPASYPGATEVCDGKDNSCDGQIDEGVTSTFYLDLDLDGYGDPTVTTQTCTAPEGFVPDPGFSPTDRPDLFDCDDSRASVNPGELEACGDGIDDNCDGQVDEGCPSACTSIQNGGAMPVEIPVVDITFSVTLAGKPISASNASSTDYGSIRLRDPATGRTFKVSDLWDLTNDVAIKSFTAPVVPGTYDVLYSVQANGANAPDNENAVLRSGVDLTASQTLTVDIPVVPVQFTTTLGGKALSGSNTSSTDYGGLSLRDLSSGEKFPLYKVWDPTLDKLSSSYAAQLVPGTYDVVYSVELDGANWPANTDVVVKSGLVISSSQSITVDIPTVSLATTVTLDGQAVSAGNASAGDYGKIELRNTSTLETFKLFDTWNVAGDVPQGSFTAQVVPGTYDVLYSAQLAGGNWPANKKAVLKSAVPITSSQSLSLNLTPVRATLSATLGGQAVSASNTSSTDYGQLRLRDAAGNSFKVFNTFDKDSGKPVSSGSAQVLPAVYDVIYEVKAAGGNWPLNEKAVVKADVTLSAAQTLAIDIPVAQVTCNLTLAGKAVSAGNTSSTDYGKLDLRDTVTGDRFKLCSAWDTTNNTIGVPASVRIIPGSYSLLYDGGVDGANWPGNQEVTLQPGVDISAGQTVKLDVPVVSATFTLTLGGQALSPLNTSATDSGLIDFWDSATPDDIFTALDPYDGTAGSVVSSTTVSTLPGTYQLVYSLHDNGGHWPVNQGQPLGCFSLE